MQAWGFLLAAIVLEVAGTTCMKLSDGFSRPVPSVLMALLYGLSFACLTMAVKRIEIGVAYAVWAGTGTALIALVGIAFFQEMVTSLKLASIAMIILGVVGLNLEAGG
ncbi:DMT family transporter [Thiohalorhabdus sp. Cl-TMA]|uniref:Multidrug efflux SMR transporter n=1 Tax=Thiohalorhabdus methylotrophus TaxID=3242694 RepID=A0ABV4TU47_9GAMM